MSISRVKFIFSGVMVFAVLLLTACNQAYYHAAETQNLSRPVNPEIATENSRSAEQVAATIAPYQEQLSAKMDETLNNLTITLEKARPESRLGNFVADLTLAAANDLFPDLPVNFAVQNYGGLRIPELAAGPLTAGKIYELMPFDNLLVVVEMNGFVLNEFVNHMAADGGWPVSKGLRYRIEDGKAVDILVDGEAIQFNRNYFVALPDYVANGGSDSKMLTDRKQYNSNQLIRDLLLTYTRRLPDPITVELDGRVSKN